MKKLVLMIALIGVIVLGYSQSSGDMRYSGGDIQYYDGAGWVTLSSTSSVNPETFGAATLKGSATGKYVYTATGGTEGKILVDSIGSWFGHQVLSISNDTIYLEDGGFVVLPSQTIPRLQIINDSFLTIAPYYIDTISLCGLCSGITPVFRTDSIDLDVAKSDTSNIIISVINSTCGGDYMTNGDSITIEFENITTDSSYILTGTYEDTITSIDSAGLANVGLVGVLTNINYYHTLTSLHYTGTDTIIVSAEIRCINGGEDAAIDSIYTVAINTDYRLISSIAAVNYVGGVMVFNQFSDENNSKNSTGGGSPTTANVDSTNTIDSVNGSNWYSYVTINEDTSSWEYKISSISDDTIRSQVLFANGDTSETYLFAHLLSSTSYWYFARLAFLDVSTFNGTTVDVTYQAVSGGSKSIDSIYIEVLEPDSNIAIYPLPSAAGISTETIDVSQIGRYKLTIFSVATDGFVARQTTFIHKI